MVARRLHPSLRWVDGKTIDLALNPRRGTDDAAVGRVLDVCCSVRMRVLSKRELKEKEVKSGWMVMGGVEECWAGAEMGWARMGWLKGSW